VAPEAHGEKAAEPDALGKLVSGFLDAIVRFALGLCDAQALVAPVAHKQKSKPTILVHASAEDFREQFLHPASQPAAQEPPKRTVARAPVSRKRSVTSEVLVMRQIHFRNERNRSRRKRQQLCAGGCIEESDEESDTSIVITSSVMFEDDLRMAAVIMVQSWGRAYLHGIDEEAEDEASPQPARPRLPVFLRASFVAPTAAEFDERRATLGRRFPDAPPASVEAALRRCNGHGGCAAGELR